MSTTILIKKLLKNIRSESFICNVYASEGGRCSSGWDGTEDLELTSEEILYLLKQRLEDCEVFTDLPVKTVDIEQEIYNMARESAWPEGGPTAKVNNIIPDELLNLAEQIEDFDEESDSEKEEILGKIYAINEGEYTFHFTVVDGMESYYFNEDAEVKIYLLKDDILGLLYGEYHTSGLFDSICNTPLFEDFINDKALENNIADDYDYFDYGGSSESLETYLNSWKYIIENIISGKITEDTINQWLEYFRDSDNYNSDIDEWFEEQE